MFQKYKKKIIYSIVFGALVYLALSIYAKFDELLAAFGMFFWWVFPIALVLSFCNYIFRYFKWEYYTKLLGVAPSRRTNLLIFLSSFTMAVTPGKLGEVFKSYLLKEQNSTPVSKSAPIVIAERITDFLSLIMLSIAGAVIFETGAYLIFIVGVFFILTILVISSKKVSYFVISFFESFKFFSKFSHRIHTAYDSIYQLVRFKPLVYAVVLSIFSWFFECFEFFIIIHSFGIENLTHINIFVATFIYGFATIAGAVTMLPGGLGVTDASMPFLLVKLSKTISENVAIAATIITRVATLWFAVLVGIISVLIYQRVSHKKIGEIVLEN